MPGGDWIVRLLCGSLLREVRTKWLYCEELVSVSVLAYFVPEISYWISIKFVTGKFALKKLSGECEFIPYRLITPFNLQFQ